MKNDIPEPKFLLSDMTNIYNRVARTRAQEEFGTDVETAMQDMEQERLMYAIREEEQPGLRKT